MDLIKRYDSPHRLHLETTKRCNLLCEHCYISASDQFKDYDISTLKDVMLKTREKGASRITFTGGEFLIRNDHLELIQYAVDIGYRNIYFITNGIYLKKSTLEWLASLKVTETIKSAVPVLLKKTKPITLGLGISLDGLRGNELIRKHKNKKPVLHKELLETIELATKYGIYVTVNTTVCNSTTASELFDIYELLLKLNVDRWQVDQVFMSGRSTQSNMVEDKAVWIDIAKQSYYRILNDYIRIYPHKTKMKLEIVQLFRSAIMDYGFKILNDDNHHPCEYQFGSVIVEDGETVRFCPSLRYDGDDIFNIGLNYLSGRSYASNKKFSEFAGITIKNLPCKECRYKLIAHGGCRGNSVSYNHRLYAKDPVCCAFAPFLEEKIIPLLSFTLQKQYKDALFLDGKHPDEILDLDG
jgi:radical SAM protein with 4Fe4S-binding SPASM domain